MQQTAATKSAGSFFFCVSYSYSFHAGGSVFKMVSQPGLDGLRWFKMVSQHVQAGLKMITQTWNLKSAQNHVTSSLRGQLRPQNQAWSPRSLSLAKQEFSWAANWSYKFDQLKSILSPYKISLGDKQTTKPV